MCENGVIIRPIFLEGNRNGERYLEILNDIIIPHLQDEFGHRFNYLWWAQNGAPSNRRIVFAPTKFSITVKLRLDMRLSGHPDLPI